MRCGKKGRGEGGRWSSALREGGGMTDVGEGGKNLTDPAGRVYFVSRTNAAEVLVRVRDEEDFAAPGGRLTSSNGV
uniref:Uncharacterized protein n=1 Tax=Vespula pensylvanica TaxID=30213 RepID=A0A834PEJ5_VESPE|nr:hypothetical protein H0235_000812 [Vespula pensylvanica]